MSDYPRRRTAPSPGLWPLIVFALALVALLMLTPQMVAELDPVTGDEPYYLQMAQSLLRDGDLDMANNYAQKDYLDFYPKNTARPPFRGWESVPWDLPPHQSNAVRPGLYEKHGAGLAVLVAPAYQAGGRLGTVLFMNILGALLAANIFLLAREFSGDLKASLITTLGLAFTSPLLPYSFLIFPAVPAALMAVYAFRRIRLSPENNAWQLAGTALCLSFLPWLHAGYLLLSLPLFAYFLARNWGGRGGFQTRRGFQTGQNVGADLASAQPAAPEATLPPGRLTGLSPGGPPFQPAGRTQGSPLRFYVQRGRTQGSPLLRVQQQRAGARRSHVHAYALVLPIVALSGAAFLYYYYSLYATAVPNYGDHAGFSFPLGTLQGMLGFFLDQQWGLATYSPFYLVGLAGMVLVFRRGRREGAWLLAATAPTFVFFASYNQWWGEWCPPARYLVPILPFAAPAVALVLREAGWPGRSLAGALLALSLALMGGFLAVPKLMYNHPTGESQLFLALAGGGGLDLTRWLPSLVNPGPAVVWQTSLAGALAAAAVLFLLASTKWGETPKAGTDSLQAVTSSAARPQ